MESVAASPLTFNTTTLFVFITACVMVGIMTLFVWVAKYGTQEETNKLACELLGDKLVFRMLVDAGFDEKQAFILSVLATKETAK